MIIAGNTKTALQKVAQSMRGILKRIPIDRSATVVFIQDTPARTHSISGLKSRVLKLTFLAQNDGQKWPRTFYFEIHRAPSEIPANLPARLIQPFWAELSALGCSNSEGARGISK